MLPMVWEFCRRAVGSSASIPSERRLRSSIEAFSAAVVTA
jgi:hypothetical protein